MCHKCGHITFTDRRECEAGIGLDDLARGHVTRRWRWGLPRSLTPNAFKAELSRLVGIETADQVIREITQGDFFDQKSRLGGKDNIEERGLSHGRRISRPINTKPGTPPVLGNTG